MLLIEDEEDLGPIPFWFSPLWKEQEGFMTTVSKDWDIPFIGSPNFVWEIKLENTKDVLKKWVKLSQKNPISDRKEALEKLEEIQMEMDNSQISPDLLEKEKRAQFSSFRALRRE